MARLAPIWGILSIWYVSASILAVLGIILGSMVFFNVWPGKPKIGIINIPFTVISERSAREITAMLEYARLEDSIKGVVIVINSPGGGAAASEELFFETVKLREKKPVVFVMQDLVASGGYMMALGGSYLYAKPSSFIGSIGVILAPLPDVIPRPPSEREVLTGPAKSEGGDRRLFVALTDQLKRAFVHMVLSERGDHLTVPLVEVTQGQIFSGVEAVRLGLADAIGGRSDAIQKTASQANISGYELVDVNTEVSVILNRKIKRVREVLADSGEFGALASQRRNLAGEAADSEFSGDQGGIGILLDGMEPEGFWTLPLPGGIGEDPNTSLPGFPLTINRPNAYYLYVGPSP